MQRINDKQVNDISETLLRRPELVLYLQEACNVLNLSLKDDSEIIFEIL